MDSIIKRAFSPFAVALRAITLTLVICATGGAWADFAKTNPVTGETENYTWKFVGTDTWDGTGNWQDSSGANPSGTPAKSGENTWDPILFDGDTININASMSVEGWNLRMGLYNGANVTMNTFVKYQGDTTMWMTVDETSQLTIGGFGGGNITDGQVIKLSVARANGITWNVNLTSVNANNTFEYYLKGAGSVSYQAVSAASHKIKMADVTLTGTSQVSSKTLVSFTSSTPTFTADAIIKLLDSNGDQVDTKSLSTVTQTATLTTDDAVGSCELVQTATSIVLYWVDGDPNALTPTVYKPSININFTSGTALSTVADVGLGEYAIPGTSWNNLIGNNGSLAALNAVDSSGTPSATAASVTISGTRGYWSCSSLTAASDLRHGYIDESASGTTPTVTVSGIPYDKYRVIVYTATDAPNKTFGYITVNGKNYTYVNNVLTEDTSAWGASGGQDTAEAMAEGVNVLVSPVTLGSTLTVVGHRSGDNTRGCIAAIQIIEVTPEIGENDLEIHVSGDTTYTVSEAKNLSGTVYLTGNGTLTLDGSDKIEAATINVGPNVVLNINADRLDATTFTGEGTVVYNGAVPPTTKGWNNASAWSGVLWIKNVTANGLVPADLANANSTLRLTGVEGYFNNNGTSTFSSDGTLDLQDDGATKAFTVSNGWSANGITVFEKLTGSGTLTQSNHDIFQRYVFKDVSAFTGTIDIPAGTGNLGAVGNRPLRVIIGNVGTFPDTDKGTVTVASGTTATVGGGTWNAAGGIKVLGALVVAGDMTMGSDLSVASGATLTVNSSKKLTLDKAYNLDGTVNVNGTLYSSDVNLSQTINGTVNVAGAFDAQGDVTISSTGSIAVTGNFWPNYGVTVNGNLSAPSLTNISSTTYTGQPQITVNEGGVFTFINSNNTTDQNVDYGRITGTGTLRYANVSGKWRALSQVNFPTGMICENNLSEGLILATPSTVHTIGSLAGSGKIRSDYSNGNRDLTILQAKDTTWSGVFSNADRIGTVTVNAGASTTGTLTLSGTQDHSNALTVNGAVNLTGTWVGATTVSGTFGGTGTLTGNLTFSDGATFKANATRAMTVSGTVTFPGEGESATVDISEVTKSITSSGLPLISSGVSDISNVAVASGYFLDVDDGALNVYPLAATVTFSDNSVTNYPSVQAALAAVASLGSSAYKYVTAYESATLDYFSANTLKLKTEGVGVVVSLHFPGEYGDYGWVGGEPDDGVVSYTPGPISTVYTWNGGESGNWWVSGNWKFGADYSANRLPTNCDDVIFADGAEVAVAGNQTVSSITNSAAVTFTAGSAATITASTGGIVLTDVDATITVSNVTLSPTPTTSIAGKMVVGNTNPETSAVTYSVVDIAATIGGTPYATLAEASEALKTAADQSVLTLQQDFDGTATIYPGKYLVQNGHTVTSVVGADTDGNTDDGIVVTRYGNSVANYYWSCADQRTATWSGAASAFWAVMGNWAELFTPTAYTAVTIPASEGHATAITLSGDVAIKSLTLGAGETLTLSRSGETSRTFAVSQDILLTSGQSITLGEGVTLNATLDTNDARSRVVYDSSTKTYSVQVIPGTIFSVY